MPSYLLKYGDSLDIICAETGQSWENEQTRQAQQGGNGMVTKPTPKLSEKEMLAMVERAKKYEQNSRRPN